MIVTSKRCFLNVLTQIMDKETLLNANYYIADVLSPTGGLNLADRMCYNESGQLVNETRLDMETAFSAMGEYNITYGRGELDPTPFVAHVLVGANNDNRSSHERFMDYLSQTTTMIQVYSYLFKKELSGNKLQILVFCDEVSVTEYAGIVCDYLSFNFGEDITFIDPQYRKDVKGKVQYVGNKQYAYKLISDLRDAELLIQFQTALTTTCSKDAVISNLGVFLSSFNMNQLFHLYALLHPTEPLQPDYYTEDHLRQIIIDKATYGMRETSSNMLDNIYTTDDLTSMLAEYDASSEDVSVSW